MSKLFIWLVPFQMWLWRARSFIFRFHGPLSPSVHLSEFRLLPREFTYSWCRFHLLCKQNKQTMRGFPTIPENNSSQQHSGSYLKKKKTWRMHSVCSSISPLLLSSRERLVLWPHVSPGFDKFIFIKNTSKTAFYSNPRTRVVDISLFCVCMVLRLHSKHLTQLVCISEGGLVGGLHTYMHHTHIHAAHTHLQDATHTHTHTETYRTSRTHSAVFAWKATLKNNNFFSFWHLQIKRDMSYLCSSVAAKSLSPRGTKQGFVVGFARAAQCLCVKHPKL